MRAKLLGPRWRHVKYNLRTTIDYLEQLKSFGCTYEKLLEVKDILVKAEELIELVDNNYRKVYVDDNLDF